MFRQGVLIACCIGGIGQVAEAGAWLRGPGDTFLSYGTNLRFPADGSAGYEELSLFLEYGFSSQVTLGFDVNWVSSESAHVVGFMRRPLGKTDGPVRMSYTLGAGARLRPQGPEPMFRLGASLGHGFETVLGNAWGAVDAQYEFEPMIGEDLMKLDATLGISFESNIKAMIQLFWSRASGERSSLEFAPSTVFPLEDNMNLQIGLVARTGPEENYGVRASYWLEF